VVNAVILVSAAHVAQSARALVLKGVRGGAARGGGGGWAAGRGAFDRHLAQLPVTELKKV
jgi:hypothetical protein